MLIIIIYEHFMNIELCWFVSLSNFVTFGVFYNCALCNLENFILKFLKKHDHDFNHL